MLWGGPAGLSSTVPTQAARRGCPRPAWGGQGDWHHQQSRTLPPTQNTYTPYPVSSASGKTLHRLSTQPTPHRPFASGFTQGPGPRQHLP